MSTSNAPGTVTCTVQEIPPTPPPRVVTLTMPYDVAVTLHHLTYKVGGYPVMTYRGDVDRIRMALEAAGFPSLLNADRFSKGVEAEARS